MVCIKLRHLSALLHVLCICTYLIVVLIINTRCVFSHIFSAHQSFMSFLCSLGRVYCLFNYIMYAHLVCIFLQVFSSHHCAYGLYSLCFHLYYDCAYLLYISHQSFLLITKIIFVILYPSGTQVIVIYDAYMTCI